MKKLAISLALLAALLGAGTFSYLLFTGPRMKQQPSIQPFNAVMPLPPKRSVPQPDPLASPVFAPAAPTPDNLARGKTYYAYYCLPCHGQSGAGDGPVGQSYVPTPADLRSMRLASLSDSQYLFASLTGPGHAPVLHRVVPPQHRPALLLYCRSLLPPSPK